MENSFGAMGRKTIRSAKRLINRYAQCTVAVEPSFYGGIHEAFEVEKTAMLAVRTIQEIADLMISLKDPDGPLLTTLADMEESSETIRAMSDCLESLYR